MRVGGLAAPNIKYLTIPRPSGWTLQPKNGRARQIEKSIPGRVLGYCVPDVPEQKSAFHDTWFSNDQ